MGRQIKGTLYYMFINVRFTLTIFWIIIGAILLLSLILSLIMSEGTIDFQLSFSVYVFCTIIGMWTVKNTLPYLIKLGSTRKNLYISTGIYLFLFALFNALLANVINGILVLFGASSWGSPVEIQPGEESIGSMIITTNDGESAFRVGHLAQFLENDSFLARLIIDTSICFLGLSIMFIIGLVFYRYGLIGGFSFLGVLFLTFIIGMAKGWIIEFFMYVFNEYSLVIFAQFFITGLVVYLLSYLLLRRLVLT